MRHAERRKATGRASSSPLRATAHKAPPRERLVGARTAAAAQVRAHACVRAQQPRCGPRQNQAGGSRVCPLRAPHGSSTTALHLSLRLARTLRPQPPACCPGERSCHLPVPDCSRRRRLPPGAGAAAQGGARRAHPPPAAPPKRLGPWVSRGQDAPPTLGRGPDSPPTDIIYMGNWQHRYCTTIYRA